MNLYLALDTATDYGSVALGGPGALAAELLVAERRHAAALVPAIEEVLRVAGVGYRDLTGMVVADGPGSFTGLRIGFATAKGILCEHEHLRLLTAPSLLAAAWAARFVSPGPIAALYDALRGEVFGAVFGFERERVVCHLAPMLGTVPQIAAASPVEPTIAVGDGAILHPEAIRAWTGRDPVGPPDFLPRAGAFLHLLELAGGTTELADPASFQPAYGRLAEAEVRLQKGQWGRQGR